MSRSTLNQMRRYTWLYVMVLPVLIYFAVFVYYPLYEGVRTSFMETKLLGGSTYVGLDNYRTVVDDPQFWQVVRNTLLIGGGMLFIGFFPPIILALALNEVSQLLFKKTVQTAIYLPHLFSWVVIGGMWVLLLQPSGGLINELLALINIGPIQFLTSTSWARSLMIALPIWKDMGYSAIIYLAAITSLNPALYEAARIDGASRFQQMYQITLPLLTPTMKVVFMLGILGVLRIFDQIYVMKNGVIASKIDVVMTYVYTLGIQQHKLGVSSAISVMVLVSTLILTGIVWKLTGFSQES